MRNSNIYFGEDKPCLIIGEIAQAHDGSLGMAHAYIDAIALAGANAIKFQTHIANAESSVEEPWRVKFSYQDDTRFEYWQRMEFTKEQWIGLKKHCDEKNLLFISSPFSIEAVELLDSIDMPIWKVASGEVNNPILIDAMLKTEKPILFSSGMSYIDELDSLVEKLSNAECDYGIMQCTSAYPCPPEKIGINNINYFKNKYKCPVGLSDHSGVIYPSLAAATIGIDVLEVHVTMSREMFGPDVVASVTTTELKQIVDGVRYIEKMNGNSIEKDNMTGEIAELRDLFTKSIAAKTDLPIGHTINFDDLIFVKPGTGIKAEKYKELIGKKIIKEIKKGSFFEYNNLEG